MFLEYAKIEQSKKGSADQGAKKIIFTACLSGKLKLEFTSPDIISNSPKPFWRAELISQFFCYSNSSKSITCPSGKLKTKFTCPIAKSTSPGLSDTTFFARWLTWWSYISQSWEVLFIVNVLLHQRRNFRLPLISPGLMQLHKGF